VSGVGGDRRPGPQRCIVQPQVWKTPQRERNDAQNCPESDDRRSVSTLAWVCRRRPHSESSGPETQPFAIAQLHVENVVE
jgi:hypothetical protein